MANSLKEQGRHAHAYSAVRLETRDRGHRVTIRETPGAQ